MELRRIKAVVRYDGAGFSGSQVQPGKRTVQGTLKVGLERLLGHPVDLVLASRTDTGVHAEGNVAAFDAKLPFPVQRLPRVLNPLLMPDLELRSAEEAAPGFNPRFAASGREYVYRVYRGADVPVDRRRYVASYDGKWDQGLVDEALALLPARRSFRRFAAGGLGREHSSCDLQLAVQEGGGPELLWRLRANRFLRSMVCRLAGALLAIADARLDVADFAAALADEKSLRFKPAPPWGLTLVTVHFAGGDAGASEKTK